MRMGVMNNFTNQQSGEDDALLHLLLSTVASHHHIHVHKAVTAVGVVAALSEVVTKYWDNKQKEEALEEVLQWVKLEGEDGNITKGVYVKILVDTFNVDKHLYQVSTHKKFITKTFNRFNKIFPNISEKQISEHDLSKYSFIEMIGYTDRWVWGVSSPAWHTALLHHYTNNPHHPQHENINNNAGDMDQTSSNKMSQCHLEESVVDMLACHWERRQGGREGATAREIADFGGVFLERYTVEERRIVEVMLDKVRKSDL